MPCPYCTRNHSMLTRLTGDQILCACGMWVVVASQYRRVLLLPLGPPAPLFPTIDSADLLRRLGVWKRLTHHFRLI